MTPIEQKVELDLVERYRVMLEPLGQYVDVLSKMLFFQHYRFSAVSSIQCGSAYKKQTHGEPCHHVACPYCWHAATLQHMGAIYQGGIPQGVRLRVITDVPPALNTVDLVKEVTAGEVPWVHDSRCEVNDTAVRRVVVLSGLRHPPQADRSTATVCGQNLSPTNVRDFASVARGFDAWFSEAPPPFIYPDYEVFIRLTKDYDFGETLHVYDIPPGYVHLPEVDNSLLGL